MKKKILSGVLVMLMTLTACGGPGGGGDDPLSAARANMDAVTSMDGTMVMELDMEIAGEVMESVTTMNMTVFNDPMRLKMDMSMEVGLMGEAVTVPYMALYAEEDGAGGYTMYLQQDGSGWQVQQATPAELEEYDFSGEMGGYMDSVASFTQAGTERVDGVEAYKYTGAITGREMEEVMRSSGALDSMGGSLGLSGSELESMLSGLGDITVSLWISQEDLFPIRYEMDMTGIMDALVQNIMESAGGAEAGLAMRIPKMVIVLTCSNINSATEFTIPDEARSAS